tara:strand:- start:32639 stop:32833 length:195 start_codon:yes stop_codon:yes gene_type:complete
LPGRRKALAEVVEKAAVEVRGCMQGAMAERQGEGFTRWCTEDGRGEDGLIAREGRGIRRIEVEM